MFEETALGESYEEVVVEMLPTSLELIGLICHTLSLIHI